MKKAKDSMREAEAYYLYSVMESATVELRRFEVELCAKGETEMSHLVGANELAWKEVKAMIASHGSHYL